MIFTRKCHLVHVEHTGRPSGTRPVVGQWSGPEQGMCLVFVTPDRSPNRASYEARWRKLFNQRAALVVSSLMNVTVL
jgi:hypothetical protein